MNLIESDKFGVLDYDSISCRNLIDHINRAGIIFYDIKGINCKK